MDIFENKIDKTKFQSTNELWNELQLNASWSVGCISNLIKKKKFRKKEDWYNFYFESGEQRLKKIQQLKQQSLTLCNEERKFLYKDLNDNYGRTKSEIAKKGTILYRELIKRGNPKNLTESECKFIAYYRVVCESWNGIIIRETKTKESIEDYLFEQGYSVSLIDTTGKFDCFYSVDFELYYEGIILCGIQVKPLSYQSDKIYLKQAKIINESKNKNYIEQFSRNVLYVYSSQSGKISNTEIYTEIINIINNNKKIAC